MTEKRFTTDNGSHEDVCLVDNLTKKEYESNFEDMVSLMNDIWNQTQRFEKHNQRLEKENEQLKSRVEYLERKIDRERTSYQKQHEKWEEEIQKENEQLKHECNYLQNRLDDFINIQNENEQLKAINEYLIEILEHTGATVEIKNIKGDLND